MARVYADVNQQMPRSYWDYDSVNITWGILENYEVVRKIGKGTSHAHHSFPPALSNKVFLLQDEGSTQRSLKASTL